MKQHTVVRGLIVGLALVTSARLARGQGPTVEVPERFPTGTGSLLGNSPGEDPALGSSGAGQGSLGGRPGASSSRAPASISLPGGAQAPIARPTFPEPLPVPSSNVPVSGTLDFPAVANDEGPTEGLTLDAAIEILVRDNLYLRAAAFEIPQAEADILTASLRANPVLYADAQLIPYGSYTRQRPGGQTQYDLNISYPLDITFKRRARIVSATRAKLVLEQQYRDAVRQQLDNLYTEYANVLGARSTLRYAAASVEGLDRILVPIRSRLEQGESNQSEFFRAMLQRETAEIGRRDAEMALRRNKVSLANLLNFPPEQAESLEVRGSLRDSGAEAPPDSVLIEQALHSRPDLAAFRLGVSRAEADVRLAEANRLNDVYLLYQPYTLQDNHHQPMNRNDARSWALGVTVPIPIYNRNQGNIQRARLNVGQTQTQLASQLRQVIADVQQAEREYRITLEAVRRVESTLAPYARQILENAQRRYLAGEEDLLNFLAARSDYSTVVKQYLDTLVRHRRAMLALNTAVGRRVLP